MTARDEEEQRSSVAQTEEMLYSLSLAVLGPEPSESSSKIRLFLMAKAK